MGYVPKHEDITGASLSGTDGTANRTYTLANDSAILAQMQIVIAGAILQANIDFTLDTDTNTLTFINLVWDDQNISLDYFIDDATSTTEYDSGSYTITGSDLTGSDGTANRTFIFVNNKAIVSDMMQIVVDNTALVIGTDFTYNTTTKTIKFLNAIFDASNISIDFLFTFETYYANTLQITRFSGIGIEIELEELGTGDNSTRSFDSDEPNIIDGSFTLYTGVSASNQLDILVEGTDYQIALDDGRIYLTASGVTSLGTGKLYLTYVSSPKQSNSVLVSYLPAAQAEVNKLTGNYWGSVASFTQYFDGYTDTYPHTERPFGETIENQPEFELKYKSIQSITSVSFLDFEGNVSSTPTSSYIRFDEDGRVLLGPTTVPNGKRNVKIVFTSGYSTVPDQIQELCAIVAGLMALVNISGGSYKDVSTYTLGRKTFSIGQVYVNIESSIKQMNNRIATITGQVGPNYSVA